MAIHTLWNIRIIVLAKPEHENRISHIFSDSVKTGIANTLGTDAAPPVCSVMVNAGLTAVSHLFPRAGNKGAVGVSFMFNGTSFGFVNSHLTSGSEKKLRWGRLAVVVETALSLITWWDLVACRAASYWLALSIASICWCRCRNVKIVTIRYFQKLCCSDKNLRRTIDKNSQILTIYYLLI